MLISSNLYSNKVYRPAEISDMIEDSGILDRKTFPIRAKRQYDTDSIGYYNAPAAFDIETTSFEIDGEKYATMYIWQFSLCGLVMYGRKWEEWDAVQSALRDRLGLADDLRLVVGVHNLGYEFGFIGGRYEWGKVFALDAHKPVYAENNGIEYRCTYILSGYGLAELGKNLTKYKVEKLSGDLDYTKMRHYDTPLTDTELGYCLNDVRVVVAYLQEQIEYNGNNITKIPLTKTGYVRRYCRKMCFYGGNTGKIERSDTYHAYRNMMQAATMEVPEYLRLKEAYQGGFTHANADHADKTLYNVDSYDFNSSYPACMTLFPWFPMGKGWRMGPVSFAEYERLITKYCCVATIRFTGLDAAIPQDNPFSFSKCWGITNAVVNNGRIVGADTLTTTITELDYLTAKKAYTFESAEIIDLWCYHRGRLPRDLVLSILKLYGDKTRLKGIAEQIVNYMRSKEDVNAAYGMMCMDPVRDEVKYIDGVWSGGGKPAMPEIMSGVEKYNRDKKRFLCYAWGVYVTAIARYNLWNGGIIPCGDDYIYSDTDSVKVLNPDKHSAVFTRYNSGIDGLITDTVNDYNIPREMFEPSTIKGVKKTIGYFDFDGHFTRFKTLGAKRYLVEEDNEIKITVAGLAKKAGCEYLVDKYGADGVFNAFTDDLRIPAIGEDKERITMGADKKCHTYLPTVPFIVQLTDYTGQTREVSEIGGIHMKNIGYNLSISEAYAAYLAGFRDKIE